MDPRPRELDTSIVPPADPEASPDSFVVVVDVVDRIAFHDWTGPATKPGVLLVHGLAATSWTWAPVARRLARVRRVVAMDLRGHGISDAPTHGYRPDSLADDAIAVAEGAGLTTSNGLVIAGHGFGAMVAAWTAAMLGSACGGLVLVDGGWEATEEASGVDEVEFLRTIAEPPEVLRSMSAWLADRRSFDPTTWDADQERAARDAVVELPVGRLAPVARPHVIEACVSAMFAYRPEVVLASVEAPIVALRAADDDLGTHARTLAATQDALMDAERPPISVVDLSPAGHNLMRYRPTEVAAAILATG